MKESKKTHVSKPADVSKVRVCRLVGSPGQGYELLYADDQGIPCRVKLCSLLEEGARAEAKGYLSLDEHGQDSNGHSWRIEM